MTPTAGKPIQFFTYVGGKYAFRKPADQQQVAEFLRWIGETQGIGPEAAKRLCEFFYGKGVVLNLEEA